jgi:hypothetical protein
MKSMTHSRRRGAICVSSARSRCSCGIGCLVAVPAPRAACRLRQAEQIPSMAELGAPRLSAARARLQSQQRTAVARLTKAAGQEIALGLSAPRAEDGLPSKPVQVARRAQAAHELCPTSLVAMQATRQFRPMSARALGPMVITALTHRPQNAGHARFSACRTREQTLALAGMTTAAQATQDLG